MDKSFATLFAPGSKILWVATAGGHLAELKIISEMCPAWSEDSTWVTFDTAQSRSMLEGQNVKFVDYISPRDFKGTARLVPTAYGLLSKGHYDAVVTTGAAIAGAFLPLAGLFGAKATYIESLTRTTAPSVTGRAAEIMPGVRCLTQYRSWSRPGWSYDGTILDGWERTERDTGEPIRHVTVSAGSIRPYRFDRLIDAVLQRVSEEQDVTWQLGATEREGLRGDVHESLPWSELGDKIRSSDVYVCHAGVGSVLQALENGKIPILAVRSAVEHEHVDDHQGQLAREIVSRGLAIELDLSRPTGREFAEACRYGVRKRDDGDGTGVVRAEGMAAAAVPTAGAAVRVEAAAGDDPVIRLSGTGPEPTGPEPTGDAPVTVPVHHRRRAGVGQS